MTSNVVEKILEQATPERIKQEIKNVKETDLSLDLQKWVKEYSEVGGERGEFIWKWLYKINKVWFYIPTHSQYSSSLAEIKTLCNMFIVLLDDAAVKKGKDKLLAELLKITFDKEHIRTDSLTDEERGYLAFTQRIWIRMEEIIHQYPKYNQLNYIFDFDFLQFTNAIRYTNLIYNNPAIINTSEYWLYLSHKMQIVVNLDFDLMCTTLDLDSIDFNVERRRILVLQKMGRIGNWMSTWKREVLEGDFSSGMIAYAIENNIINKQDVQKNNYNKIIDEMKRPHGIDDLLKSEWEKCYQDLDDIDKYRTSINNKKFLKLTNYFLLMHIIGENCI